MLVSLKVSFKTKDNTFHREILHIPKEIAESSKYIIEDYLKITLNAKRVTVISKALPVSNREDIIKKLSFYTKLITND